MTKVDNKEILAGKSNGYSTEKPYNKITILSEMLKGREVVITDDVREEYKSLLDIMETDNNIKLTN